MTHLTPLAASLEAAGMRLPMVHRRGLWTPPHVVRQALAAHGAPLTEPAVLGMQVEWLQRSQSMRPPYITTLEESAPIRRGQFERFQFTHPSQYEDCK